MRLWRDVRLGLVAVALGMVAASTAHGQVISVYGLFHPIHATGVDTGSVYSNGVYTEQQTSFWAPAVGGGVTFNFLNLHVVKLGLDARGSTKPGTTGADTAQVGIRLGIQPPVLRIKPYLQAGVGYLATRTTNVSTPAACPVATPSCSTTAGGGTFTNKYATIGFQGGIDDPLVPFMDWRLIELGVTHTVASFGSGNANTFSIATGLVFHF